MVFRHISFQNVSEIQTFYTDIRQFCKMFEIWMILFGFQKPCVSENWTLKSSDFRQVFGYQTSRFQTFTVFEKWSTQVATLKKLSFENLDAPKNFNWNKVYFVKGHCTRQFDIFLIQFSSKFHLVTKSFCFLTFFLYPTRNDVF